ncbi:mitochondrial carrier [Eremomyces bilateralis CBS 781.70]|uniref:Mitochondrial carrier n=1 Tax=Eremomyces bilateralis CBS 781.70 TaxID=1392243 RepID=A0A6G1G9I1_9PEZI|nr:mitochondrial carrier [Eremomyces bilateralis CBS 781.70]KAF1814596.1 mitochondrial carrier [Eremomyces bilateralis CBS 781.70]
MPERDDDHTRSTSLQASQPHAIVPSRHPYLDDSRKLWIKKYRTEIAASTSSLLSTFMTYPLDSVKTRMQTYQFSSLLDCIQHTYRTEGFHGFWRGVWSPLASITLVRTLSFSIYQKAKYTYDDWIYQATGNSPLVVANTRGALPSLSTALCFGGAGATAGAMITTIACPFELTKLSAQLSVLMANRNEGSKVIDSLSQRYQQMGTLRTAHALIKHRGMAALYAGFHYHLLRDTIGTGVYFMTYESAKQLLANARGNSPTSPAAVVTAGGLCGLASWACIYPIDSAKSIYQRNCLTGGKGETTRTKIEFFNRRMYRGLTVSMGRSCVVNAIFFSAFEFTKKKINQLEVDDPDFQS